MAEVRSANELFRDGQLDAAVAAAIETVRGKPTDAQARFFLAELFCFQGNLDRADNQLDTILKQTPDAVRVLQLRQIIRAEKWRQECFEKGRPPEFLAEPPEHLKLLLKCVVASREGNHIAAGKFCADAEEVRPRLLGTLNGQAFNDFRDLNDPTSSFFEVLTNNGVYYWVPFENVEHLEFLAPQAPRDLLWRRTQLSVRGGPDGDVCIPATYFGTSRESRDPLRLSRLTEWREEAESFVVGSGQRLFLFGEEDLSIMEISSLTFDLPAE